MEELKRRTLVRIFPNDESCPALGAGLGRGDPRELDRGHTLSEYETSGGTKEKTAKNGGSA